MQDSERFGMDDWNLVGLDDSVFGPPQTIEDFKNVQNLLLAENSLPKQIQEIKYNNESRNYLDTAGFATIPLPDNKTISQINNYSVTMPKKIDFKQWEYDNNISIKWSIENFLKETTKEWRQVFWFDVYSINNGVIKNIEPGFDT